MSGESDEGVAIRTRGLTKDFPVRMRGVRLRAVDGLDLEVREGEVFGLLGPNGSGKSTTIKLILGLLRPTRGGSWILGVPSDEARARLSVGYLPETPYFHRFLTGRELVVYYGRMCGLDRRTAARRADDVLEVVGLEGAADRRLDTYSKGMLQRVGLAQAIVHDPRLVILDEPTAGVDPVGAEAIARIIKRLKEEGRTVVICSHLLAQVESLCDRVAILDRGRLVAAGTVDELVGESGAWTLTVEGIGPDLLPALRQWLEVHGGCLRAAGPARRSLEQVFLAHVRRKDGDGANGDGRGDE